MNCSDNQLTSESRGEVMPDLSKKTKTTWLAQKTGDSLIRRGGQARPHSVQREDDTMCLWNQLIHWLGGEFTPDPPAQNKGDMSCSGNQQTSVSGGEATPDLSKKQDGRTFSGNQLTHVSRGKVTPDSSPAWSMHESMVEHSDSVLRCIAGYRKHISLFKRTLFRKMCAK
jgi:hypothetical protein